MTFKSKNYCKKPNKCKKKLNQFLTECENHHNRGNDIQKKSKIIAGVEKPAKLQ
jgi:hypothetical protein